MSLQESIAHTGAIKKVVITGWPCAWKTTGMASTVQKIAQMWRNVLVVPEAATELINAWVVPGKTVSLMDFQDLIIKKQLAQEALYFEAAKHCMNKSEDGHQNQLILLDRGLMDGGAYVDPQDFEQVLLKNNLESGEIFHGSRYDGVVCMDTAPEEYYTNENNTARHEDYSEAQYKSRRVESIWNWMEKFYKVWNTMLTKEGLISFQFDQKTRETAKKVIGIIGLPIPLEIENKYAVKSIDQEHLRTIQSPTSNIEQFYLDSMGRPGVYRARKLVQGMFTWYFHTVKGPQKYYENQEMITGNRYQDLDRIKAFNTDKIRKTRNYFLDNDQYFSFDMFQYPRTALQQGDIWLMEIEKTEEEEIVRIPSWMEVEDVTNDPRYSNAVIAGYKKMEAVN